MMRRRIFSLASLLSLLLCLATVVLWVRSYWVWDKVGVSRRSNVSLNSVKGGVWIAWNPGISLLNLPLVVQIPASRWNLFPGQSRVGAAGFGYCSVSIPFNYEGRGVVCPDWFLVLLLALLPLRWAWNARHLTESGAAPSATTTSQATPAAPARNAGPPSPHPRGKRERSFAATLNRSCHRRWITACMCERVAGADSDGRAMRRVIC